MDLGIDPQKLFHEMLKMLNEEAPSAGEVQRAAKCILIRLY